VRQTLANRLLTKKGWMKSQPTLLLSLHFKYSISMKLNFTRRSCQILESILLVNIMMNYMNKQPTYEHQVLQTELTEMSQLG
jgi:hypothetical protein